MLISNKLLALAVGFGSLALTTAYSPVQAVMRNIEYENQGYRILQSKNVNGYSIRIKNTPSSCEEGVQVNTHDELNQRLSSDNHALFSSTLDILTSTILMIISSSTFLNRERILKTTQPCYG